MQTASAQVSICRSRRCFTDDRNNTQAQLRETGLYLTESGQAGLIRQIDLSV
ncbi:hypothetical protein HW090_04365 [Pseudomonas sp. ABC1]|uniref:hypothetical protein n=1 Tax=Pseudomonas sp. ABC1 TaxID=2748080 RepID=UPI0015C38D9A|nr:hypothetical protein [Pseudomonas sp. ABC1]QLF92466.1 hypothetical protein HW090_04365 [Pseudomonas sp. ABC1]